MNKEESLTFLQSCMEKVKMASEQDIQFYREVYRLDCVSPTETSDFEFVLPTIDLQCNYEINDEYDLDACDLVSNRTPKMQLNYSFLGTNLLNQQNNDNLSCSKADNGSYQRKSSPELGSSPEECRHDAGRLQ